jgi:serine/threonine protein kinase, bacterial
VCLFFLHKTSFFLKPGLVTTLAGSNVESFADGVGIAASFSYPIGVAISCTGDLYVADNGNQRVRSINSAGESASSLFVHQCDVILLKGVVKTFAGSGVSGFADGVGVAAKFNYLNCLTVSSSGVVYVGDSDDNRIRVINSAGESMFVWFCVQYLFRCG